MRKTLFTFVLPLLLSGVLLSCGNHQSGNGKGAGDFKFESIVIDTMVNLTNAANTPKAEIHLNILYVPEEEGATLNDSLLRTGILSPERAGSR